MKIDPWICEICAEEFVNEVDMLAHQFNSYCEREIKKDGLKRTAEKGDEG